jgi:hypothetical protein
MIRGDPTNRGERIEPARHALQLRESRKGMRQEPANCVRSLQKRFRARSAKDLVRYGQRFAIRSTRAASPAPPRAPRSGDLAAERVGDFVIRRWNGVDEAGMGDGSRAAIKPVGRR